VASGWPILTLRVAARRVKANNGMIEGEIRLTPKNLDRYSARPWSHYRTRHSRVLDVDKQYIAIR